MLFSPRADRPPNEVALAEWLLRRRFSPLGARRLAASLQRFRRGAFLETEPQAERLLFVCRLTDRRLLSGEPLGAPPRRAAPGREALTALPPRTAGEAPEHTRPSPAAGVTA